VTALDSRGLAQTPLEDPELMRTLAEQAAEALADAPAEEVIRWATDTFGDRICVTSSMTDAVIIHLASAVRSGIDVVFLDTGYHFAETIGTRDAVEVVYPIHLVNVTPSRTVAEQDAELGPRLYGRNPDLCCHHQRRTGQPAGLRRLPLDRLLDLHEPGRARRRPAQRALGRDRQDRMRHPCVSGGFQGGRPPRSQPSLMVSLRWRTGVWIRARRPLSVNWYRKWHAGLRSAG